jgi:hypothetical protein
MGTFYNHLNTKQISDIDPISRFLKLKKYCYKCNKMFDLAEILRVVRGVVLSLLMNLSEGPMDMDFFKSSPPKLLVQMNRNLVGSIYGRSSIKVAHFVPIG